MHCTRRPKDDPKQLERCNQYRWVSEQARNQRDDKHGWYTAYKNREIWTESIEHLHKHVPNDVVASKK